jgi:hypothetical protein
MREIQPGCAYNCAMEQAPETVRTALEDAELGKVRRARNGRRVILTLTCLLVLLGASSMLGVRQATVSAESGGIEMTLTYAAVSRLGVATPWELQISREGGFRGPVTVATTNSYFDIFDQNDLSPQPSSSTTDGDLILWEFDPPEGETLTVSVDARIEPIFRGGRAADTSVRENGVDVVGVSYETRVMP